MRKEENLDLLKKLGSSTFDTSLLHSSKNLGLKAVATRDASNPDLATRRSTANAHESILSDDELLSEGLDDDTPNSDISQSRTISSGTSHALNAHSKVAPSTSAAGVGLKRPLDVDESGNPIIKKRQRIQPDVIRQLGELSWDGFSSETSGGHSSGIDEDQDSSLDSELDSDDSAENSSDAGSDNSGLVSLFASARMKSKSAPTRPTPRANSDFKSWALQQVNEARDFTPSGPIVQPQPTQALKPRPVEQDPLPQELQTDPNATQRKAFSVQVERTPEIQEARMQLPIVAEEFKVSNMF